LVPVTWVKIIGRGGGKRCPFLMDWTPALVKILDPRLLQVMVKNLEKEILLLKRELAMHDTLANRSQVSHEALSEQQRYEIRQQVKAYLDGNADDIDVRE